MFSFRQTLADLSPADVGNLDKAIANADAFALEVIKQLRKTKPVVAATPIKDSGTVRASPFLVSGRCAVRRLRLTFSHFHDCPK